MDCRPIPYSRTPHASKLFLRYVENFSAVSEFYRHAPTIPAAVRYARKLKYPIAQRKVIAEILREQNAALGAGSETLKNLDRFSRGGVAVVTGQQVGLFSGPAYSIYKALTAIQVARELSRAGAPAVPIFWMATEDHDLSEVNHCLWLHESQLSGFEMPSNDVSGKAVGYVKLGPQVEVLVREAAAKLSGPGAEAISRMLRESYTASDTYGSAFGKLFARLFEKSGLILLDPLDARLHKIAAPVLRRALAERDILNEKLLQRGKALENAGFAAQVKVTARSTLLFRLRDGVRQVVTVENTHDRIGDEILSREELLRQAESAPETFSPNALLRSVVQDFLLPTAAYIAGPAEIAYFAQSEVLYRHLLGKMPVILPRASFTLAETSIAKLLRKYGLRVEDVWAGREKLRAKLESKFLSASLAKRFDDAEAALQRQWKNLHGSLVKLDPTLTGALETARKKMSYQLEKLRRKAGRAREERERILALHEAMLTNALYPNRVAQQRALCLLPVLAAGGPEALDALGKLAKQSVEKRQEIIVYP